MPAVYAPIETKNACPKLGIPAMPYSRLRLIAMSAAIPKKVSTATTVENRSRVMALSSQAAIVADKVGRTLWAQQQNENDDDKRDCRLEAKIQPAVKIERLHHRVFGEAHQIRAQNRPGEAGQPAQNRRREHRKDGDPTHQ